MDRETMTYISQEVARQLAASVSTTTAAEALGRQAMTVATKAQTDASAALAVAGSADQASKVALSASNLALSAKQDQDQHVLDLMYSKFKDFFHEALLRYLDYNRKDYDTTLRDWVKSKVDAWTKR